MSGTLHSIEEHSEALKSERLALLANRVRDLNAGQVPLN